jgi:hypothetical protein
VFEAYRLPAIHASILLANGKVERAGGAESRAEPALSRTEPGAGEEVIHVVVESLERLDVPGRDINKVSRDFH